MEQQPALGPEAVLSQIKQLWLENGEQLKKKDVKKQHPEVLRSAAYYYPSWEHALSKATEEPGDPPSTVASEKLNIQ